MSAVATIEPKRSLLTDMATRYGMEPQTFASTLKATVVPANTSNEEFAAFLMVARQYNLNPITKEIYAFPKRGGGIQPIVSVDGWANLINSHPQADGIEFVDDLNTKGEVVSVTCKMYRKDRSRPITCTEYMTECLRNTDTWKQWPRRMLRHKALIQAARYAFGFAGIVDPDEGERIAEGGHYTNTPGPRLVPPPAPSVAETIPVVEITEADERELDRVTVREMNGETAAPDELADWIEDRIKESHSANSMGTLDALDDQVVKELDGAGRDELRTRWNMAYGNRRQMFADKRKS